MCASKKLYETQWSKAQRRARASPRETTLHASPATLAAAPTSEEAFLGKKKKSQDRKQAKNLIVHGYLDSIKNNHFMK